MNNRFKENRLQNSDATTPLVTFEFQTLDDLLSHEWIKDWQSKEGFVEFRYLSGTDHLIAVFEGDNNFYVIGWFVYPVEGLPEFILKLVL